MTPDDHAILQRRDAGDLNGAMAQLLQGYGQALYGYIFNMMRDPDAASDTFQVFSVRLWQALPQFRGQSKLKTWLYCIARNAALRAMEDPHARRAQALDTEQQAQLPAAQPRTVTADWQRTAEKDKLWAVISALPAEDRELLSLRLAHALPWLEIAKVMSDADSPEGILRQRAAALRKRFERLKTSLRARLSPGE